MVSLSNTWTTSLNNVPAAQDTLQHQMANIMLALSNALIADGWIVQISCNSMATSSDGTNHWNSAATDLVWAAAGVAHSYQVLISPAGMIGAAGNQLRLALQCSTGATNQHLVNVGWATANYTTSGLVTTDPTAPTNNRSFTNQQFVAPSGTLGNVHYHYEYATAGTGVGNFMFQVSRDGSGIVAFGLWALATTGYSTGDGWAAHFGQSYSASGVGGLSQTLLSSSTQAGEWWTDGTNQGVNGALLVSPQTPNNTSVMASFTSAGDNISGNFPDFSYILVNIFAGHNAFRGYVVDLALSNGAGTSVNAGTVEPSAGPTTTTIMGELWIVNGGVTPSL